MLQQARDAYERGEWHALRGRELGRTFSDPDLEGLGLMQTGQAWSFTGNTPEGLNALDEAAGELERARAALDTLARRPDLTSTPVLGALLARARGELLAGEGDRKGAIRHLRAAARSCHDASAPLAGAEVRRSLARVLLAELDLDAADVELTAAASLFRRAGASGQLTSCEALAGELRAARGAAPAPSAAKRQDHPLPS